MALMNVQIPSLPALSCMPSPSVSFLLSCSPPTTPDPSSHRCLSRSRSLSPAFERLVVLVFDAERSSDIVDDVLVGSGVVAARRFFAGEVGVLDVHVDVAGGDVGRHAAMVPQRLRHDRRGWSGRPIRDGPCPGDDGGVGTVSSSVRRARSRRGPSCVGRSQPRACGFGAGRLAGACLARGRLLHFGRLGAFAADRLNWRLAVGRLPSVALALVCAATRSIDALRARVSLGHVCVLSEP